MRMPLFGATLVASVMLVPLATAQTAARCCDEHTQHAVSSCCAVATLGDSASTALAQSVLLPAADVQTSRVVFRDPVKVGDIILMGRYVIEHDNNRMARGDPCTRIYEAADRRQPVVAFHCTHLDRPYTDTATVVLRNAPSSYPVKALTEFQFAGEAAAHGVPTTR